MTQKREASPLSALSANWAVRRAPGIIKAVSFGYRWPLLTVDRKSSKITSMVFVRCCLKYLRVGKRKHLDFESEFVDFWELRLLRSGRSKFGIFGATNAPWKCHKQPLAQADSVILHAILHVWRNPCREWRSHQQKRPCKPGTPAKHLKFQKSNCASLMILKRRDIWYRNVNTWVILLSIYIINTAWLYDCIFCYVQFAGDTLMPCQKSHERDRLHALFTLWVVTTWFRLSELLHRLFRSGLYPVDASLLWSSVVSSSCWSAGKDCPLFVSFGACPTSPPQATGHHGALFYPSLNIWHPKTTAQHGTTWKQP